MDLCLAGRYETHDVPTCRFKNVHSLSCTAQSISVSLFCRATAGSRIICSANCSDWFFHRTRATDLDSPELSSIAVISRQRAAGYATILPAANTVRVTPHRIAFKRQDKADVTTFDRIPQRRL